MPRTIERNAIIPTGETQKEIYNIWVKFFDSIIEFNPKCKIRLNGAELNIGEITSVTADSTLTLLQQGLIVCDSTSTFTVNLPSILNLDNKKFSFANVNSGTVTIDPYSSETLQGDSTFELYEDESLDIISYNSNWIVGGSI